MQQKIYDSEESLIQSYTRLHSQLSTDSFLDSQPDPALLSELKAIESAVQTLGLFSPNEEYDEVREELLAFFDLPFLMALALNKEPGVDRKIQITRSASYYSIFIELCKHMKILPKLVEKVYKELKADKNYKIDRRSS